jgi:hypothetical protein
MVYEEWLDEYFGDNPRAIDGEDLHEAWNAGWQAGVDYIRMGGSFK